MSIVKLKRLSPAQIEKVCDLFSVLREPSRITLLQILYDGPLTVGQLVETSGMKQANVSKQLAILKDHKLVTAERDGVTIRYTISDPILFALCELVCSKMEKDSREAAALFHADI